MLKTRSLCMARFLRLIHTGSMARAVGVKQLYNPAHDVQGAVITFSDTWQKRHARAEKVLHFTQRQPALRGTQPPLRRRYPRPSIIMDAHHRLIPPRCGRAVRLVVWCALVLLPDT